MPSRRTPRYVVIGAGAVGGVLAAQLFEAGHRVVLVARGEHGRRIAEAGLLVRRPDGAARIALPVTLDPAELALSADDVLVLATKTQDAEAALTWWQGRPVGGGGVRLAADLPLVSFQNGLATEPAALRRFERVYGATIGIAASYLSAGEVVSPSLPPAVGLVWVGRYPSGEDGFVAQFVDNLRSAGFAAWSAPDIRQVKAAKLLANVGNGLDLLAGAADERAEARRLLVGEAGEVLAAAGVRVSPGGLDRRGVELRIEDVPGHTPGRLSTWQSFTRGASSEVDYLNGEIVLLGRVHQVPTPVNARLQRLLLDPDSPRSLAELLSAQPTPQVAGVAR